MKLYLLVALFGAAGSVLRYFFLIITPKIYYSSFPVSTVTVNLLGSFFIGLFISLFDRGIINENIRVCITIGLLGGFTTFSTFSMDMFNLINKSLYLQTAFYICISVFLGLGFFIMGQKVSNLI
jgi:fluoride exporter